MSFAYITSASTSGLDCPGSPELQTGAEIIRGIYVLFKEYERWEGGDIIYGFYIFLLYVYKKPGFIYLDIKFYI